MKLLRALIVLLVVALVFGAPALAQDPLQGEGRINDRNPSEQYNLDLNNGQTVTITTEATSGDLDTTLALYDPENRLVAENDDRGDGTYNSQIVYTAEMSGTYVIEVGRYDDSTSGEYIVTVEFGEPEDVDTGSSADAETFEEEGRLDDVVESQSYELELDAGDEVTITTEAADDGNLDTVLFLYDPDEELVAENDDRGDGSLNSEIVYTAEDSGMYIIEVGRYDENSKGSYTLRVEIRAAGGTAAGATTEVLTADGTIDDSTETEAFEVDLEAGTVVVIDVEQTDGNLDTVATLLDPNGELVAENDDRGDGTYNSRIIYGVETTGTHTVVVSRYDSSTEGDYELTVTIDPTATPDFSFVDVEGEIIAEFTGFIDDETDTLKFTVELEAGQAVYASTEATSGDLDTVLELFNPAGELIAINDDRGDGTFNSVLSALAEDDGTYTLQVTRYEGSRTSGDFTLTVLLVDMEVVEDTEDISDQAISLSGPVEVITTEHFRVYYTRSGSDGATEEYAREFAATLEEMYDLQINQIGWTAPPAGEDGYYDTYLADVLGGEFGALGFARPIQFVGDNENSPDRVERAAAEAILVVDNDFEIDGVDTNPQTLMRATTSHEFNHVVQFGYDANEELFWLFEATAVWTETITVGDDQDATGYIETVNQYPELCFATAEFNGFFAYGDWTFLETIADRHGEQAIIRMWENAVEFDGLDVVIETLDELGETLPEAAGIWRAQNLVMDYDLGELFPRPVWLEASIDDTGDWSARSDGVQELGANYYELDLNDVIEFELDGDHDLELWVIGIDGDDADAFQLGSGGTIDLDDYERSYAMVFHTAIPRDIFDCQYEEYEIRVDDGRSRDALDEATVTFDAENFQRPRVSRGRD